MQPVLRPGLQPGTVEVELKVTDAPLTLMKMVVTYDNGKQDNIEVRQLASQTASSTDEIQAMIGQLQRQSHEAVSTMAASVSEMSSTRSQIEAANGAMGQIVERMVQVRDMANHISEAARQQQLAAEEITRNVNVVSEVSLQNYGEVEQIANSNRELTSMAHALDALTNRFRV